MRNKTVSCVFSLVILMGAVQAQVSPLLLNLFRERFTIVNMVPAGNGDETARDGEPNIAVNPENVQQIVGTAFTPNPSGALDTAPVYTSTDRGLTWMLRGKVPSANGSTGDIAVAFPDRGGVLYTGILRGGGGLRKVSLRDNAPFAAGLMSVMVDNTTQNHDQPYPTALTSNSTGSDRDHVYIGFNNTSGSNGRTASVHKSNNARTAAAPAGFADFVVEARNTASQDRPPVRFAHHGGGVVYGVFEPTTASAGITRTVNLVVVRDDNFGAGASPFTALTDPSDNVAGRLVRTNRIVHFSGSGTAFLGSQRGASVLTLAVNPANAGEVWVAYSDSSNNRRIRLHVIRSLDSGRTWSADRLTVDSVMTAALAINSRGVVGVLYQRFFSPDRWETRIQRSGNGGTSWSNILLAKFAESEINAPCCNLIGDYLDMVAVGRTFYGVFSSGNRPDTANFPRGVRYQRNADFATNFLRNTANTANVTPNSIDPFFFRIDPPLIDDLICARCGVVTFRPDRKLEIKCLGEPRCAAVVDVPEICKRVIDCPGCGGLQLCAPYYHIFLDDFDAKAWEVALMTSDGQEVRHTVNATAEGAVVSFRPEKNRFNPQEGIGKYSLVFYSKRRMARNAALRMGVRIEASEYRYKEFLARKEGDKAP